MFGFKKKKSQKKQGQLDKILMGVVVGGAIGSVLGVGLAPKKGSETRREVGRQTGKFLDKAKRAVTGAAGKIINKANKVHPAIKAKNNLKYAGKSIPEEK